MQQQEVAALGGAAADLAAQVELSRAGVASAADNLEATRGRTAAAHSDVQRLAEENAQLAAQLQRSQAEADRLAAKAEEARAAEARLEEVKVGLFCLVGCRFVVCMRVRRERQEAALLLVNVRRAIEIMAGRIP